MSTRLRSLDNVIGRQHLLKRSHSAGLVQSSERELTMWSVSCLQKLRTRNVDEVQHQPHQALFSGVETRDWPPRFSSPTDCASFLLLAKRRPEQVTYFHSPSPMQPTIMASEPHPLYCDRGGARLFRVHPILHSYDCSL